jgi:beta-galactosidase
MEKQDFNIHWSFYKQGREDLRQVVNLPHDAMIHETRNPDSAGGSAVGFFHGGVYVYEKT